MATSARRCLSGGRPSLSVSRSALASHALRLADIAGIVVLPITALFWYSCFKYFPSQFHYMSRRFAYYVFGDENVDMIAAVRGYVAELLNMLWFHIRGAPAKAAVGHEL